MSAPPSKYNLATQVKPGFATTALGDTYYAADAETFARVAGNTATMRKFWAQAGTGAVSSAPSWLALASDDIPNNAANTTGSAAKWTTARLLAGNSVDGSANATFANKFIVQGTADTGLSGPQFLGALGTGVLKNETTTGVLSIAAAADLPVPTSANGATWTPGQASELLTLSTGSTTTDTSGDLLPANSVIKAVVVRVVATITTATAFAVGDGTIADRFVPTGTPLTAGSTAVGLQHVDLTGASGPKQTAAAKVRVTATGTPAAGQVRLTVFFETYAAPTS